MSGDDFHSKSEWRMNNYHRQRSFRINGFVIAAALAVVAAIIFLATR